MQFSPEEAATRGNHYLNVVARLKPGVTVESCRFRHGAIREAPQRAVSGQQSRSRSRGRPDSRTGARRHQSPGDRLMTAASSSSSPAPILPACSWRARRCAAASMRCALARRHARTAGAAGARRSPVLVGRRRRAGPAIPVLTTTFVERIAPIGLQAFTVSLDWRLLAFAAALDRDRRVVQLRAGAATGARVHRRGVAAARAAMPADGARVSRRPRRAAGLRHGGCCLPPA